MRLILLKRFIILSPLSVGLIFIFFQASAQSQTFSYKQWNASGVRNLVFKNPGDDIRSLWNQDFKSGEIFLLLQSGIAPVVISTDADFEKKYKVRFYDFGCTGPSEDLIMCYNMLSFERLTRLYGKNWVKYVRQDVVGLKGWLRLRKKSP